LVVGEGEGPGEDHAEAVGGIGGGGGVGGIAGLPVGDGDEVEEGAGEAGDGEGLGGDEGDGVGAGEEAVFAKDEQEDEDEEDFDAGAGGVYEAIFEAGEVEIERAGDDESGDGDGADFDGHIVEEEFFANFAKAERDEIDAPAEGAGHESVSEFVDDEEDGPGEEEEGGGEFTGGEVVDDADGDEGEEGEEEEEEDVALGAGEGGRGEVGGHEYLFSRGDAEAQRDSIRYWEGVVGAARWGQLALPYLRWMRGG
jgi:hypothetical protein